MHFLFPLFAFIQPLFNQIPSVINPPADLTKPGSGPPESRLLGPAGAFFDAVFLQTLQHFILIQVFNILCHNHLPQNEFGPKKNLDRGWAIVYGSLSNVRGYELWIMSYALCVMSYCVTTGLLSGPSADRIALIRLVHLKYQETTKSSASMNLLYQIPPFHCKFFFAYFDIYSFWHLFILTLI